MEKTSLISLLFLITTSLFAQQIPHDRVVDIHELTNYLKPEVKSQVDEAQLAAYFRAQFSKRFFYDYKTFDKRIKCYNALYSNQKSHKTRALDHLEKYADSTQWVLPFNYQNGKAVNAYALRHLARQHKMVDIAFLYHNEGKDPKYIQYFVNQMRSLNAALAAGEHEKIEDGNGVYEAFRSGYRILNWLWIHNMLLNEAEYSDEDQLTTIATLLQHGQHLYEHNHQFRAGNHQTKGMAALAVLSILLSDFKGTDLWYERSMQRLSEHLNKEINPDGFQFERSVHYHMNDINNYFYVYQLAKMNNIDIDKAWEGKLKSLFTSLIKIAYPDRSAPVLQDDTDNPWAEKNDISGAMTLGYLLFEEPEFGYFASDKVEARMYWYLSNAQVDMLSNIKKRQPTYGSLAFEDTHYYIMREGWKENDKMMIISAGVDQKKPDHQHADILGIQAIANGQVILPNYQVRYSLKDFDFFKNSMVKNVALVDDELQGKKWTSNRGGSGFGKFLLKDLPTPKVISWKNNDYFDFFTGSHDGFENIGVGYSRQVIYVKDDFWIVKDNFSSEKSHTYKQVWQGHYTHEEGPNLIRATFPDASGVDILQLHSTDTYSQSGRRGKSWTVVEKNNQKAFSFVTVIFPYRGYHNRIDEENLSKIEDWNINNSNWKVEGKEAISISKKGATYFFNVKSIQMENIGIKTEVETDLHIKMKDHKAQIHAIGAKASLISIEINGQPTTDTFIKLAPGEMFELEY